MSLQYIYINLMVFLHYWLTGLLLVHKEECDYHQKLGSRKKPADRETEGRIVPHEPPTNPVIPAKAGIQDCGRWRCPYSGLRGNGSLR
jgi:hypothetical protein